MQEDGEFKASLDYTDFSFKKQPQNETNPRDIKKKAQLLNLTLEIRVRQG